PAGVAQFVPMARIVSGAPTVARNPACGASIQARAVPEQVTAVATLSRPPLVVLAANAGLGSTPRKSSALRPSPDASGKRPLASATAPVTWGVAIEVPSHQS